MKTTLIVLALAGIACGRMAYQFSDGYLDVLGAEPAQEFSCDGQIYGYYADVASECRVFHVCRPLEEGGDVEHFSFFCPNTTRFSQDTLICAHEDEAYPCADAPSIFEEVNSQFGVIPEGEK